MHYDKRNGDIVFIEDIHKYANIKHPDRQYISVTTLISKFHEEFDTDFWSSYKALEALIGVDEFKSSPIKRQLLKDKRFDVEFVHLLPIDYDEFIIVKNELIEKYARNNREACERGSKYHKQKEDAMYGQPNATLKDFKINIPELDGKQYTVVRDDCDLEMDYTVKSEFLLYWSCEDNLLNLAGQADLIIKNGNDIYVCDYKTNAKGIEKQSYFNPRTKRSDRMYYPINHLDDCNLTHYTLQLSLYAWMLKKQHPEFNIKLLALFHIDGEGNEQEVYLEYREKDVEDMLRVYKKALVEEYFRRFNRMPELKNLRSAL